MIRALRIPVLFLLPLICSFVGLRWSGALRVREVRIHPTRYVAVEKLTGEILGANILRLDLEPLRQRLLADPRVLGVVIRVNIFCLRVEIEVRERSPLVAVVLQDGRKVWVDQEGVILEEAEEGWVRGVAAEEGRVSQEVVEAALAWMRLPLGIREKYPVLDVSQGEAVAPGTPALLFGAICQVPKKLGILKELWRAGLLDGYSVVDMRFGDLVILKKR